MEPNDDDPPAVVILALTAITIGFLVLLIGALLK